MDKLRIQRVQNSCLRLIFGIRKYERVSYRLRDLNWLNMENRRLLHAAVFYHKIIVNKQPQYLANKIKYRTDVHALNLRFRGRLTPPLHHTELYKRSYSYQITLIYNNIPSALKSLNIYLFKIKMRNVLRTRQFAASQ